MKARMTPLLAWVHGAAALCTLCVGLLGATAIQYLSSTIPREVEAYGFDHMSGDPDQLQILAFLLALLPTFVVVLVAALTFLVSVVVLIGVLISLAIVFKASTEDIEQIREEVRSLRRLPVFGRVAFAIGERLLPRNGAG